MIFGHKVRSPLILTLLLFLQPSQASTHHEKRRECTLWSNNRPRVDDVPDITDALERCGNGGRIIMWREDTFNIRSPIDLSKCKGCEFQIDGILKVSSDWAYWSRQKEVIRISNASNVTITSGSAGTIDANNFGLPSGATSSSYPKLISISNRTSHISIFNQIILNTPGTAFSIDSGSTGVRLEGIDNQQPSSVGVAIENAQHVYIWRCLFRSTGACVRVAPDSSNVQVDEVNCLLEGATTTAPTGIELRLDGRRATNTIRDVFVRTFRTIGWFNAVVFTGGNTQGASQLRNITFTDVNLEDHARQAVIIGNHSGTLDAKDVVFRNFYGTTQYQSSVACTQAGDSCDFKVEDWNVTVAT